MLDQSTYQAYVTLLQQELMVAMGCTEPIAIALAAARARDLLGSLPVRVEVFASGSVVKNAKSVVVPHTGGLKGIEAAAAAGIVAGDPAQMLEVIAEVSADQIERIAEYLSSVPISVSQTTSGLDFDIVVRVFDEGDQSALVRIAEHHTNIVCEEVNGALISEQAPGEDLFSEEAHDQLLSMEKIWEFSQTVSIEDVREVLDRQIACNMAIANEGMTNAWGAQIGKVMLATFGDGITTRASAWAAAGSDARMDGCEMPVVINSGSGNQGITVSVPVVMYADELGVSEDVRYRALVLSNLIALHLKRGIGTLSAYCGAVSAGAAASGAIAYVLGGGFDEVVHAVVNTLSVTSGMVCDGAKPSCAAKIALSLNAGILGCAMYEHGQQFFGGDGIVKKGVENTIESVCRLGREGMRATNDEIIAIMLEK